MRRSSADSVTPGGASAPLGARGASAGAAAGRTLPIVGAPLVLAGVLALALLGYAALAADVVNDGRLSSYDEDISQWVADSMPAPAEWVARALSWLGGWVGVTIVVAVAVVWLLRRGERALAALLVAVALGGQLLNSVTKAGYDRPRPTAGSPIDLPSSTSFPSGHAMTGIAVFGLLGLLLARELPGNEEDETNR